MKHRIFITGFLLLLATKPTGVQAENFTCSPLADTNLFAISPYVQNVLSRADKGIAYAKEAGAATDFLSILPGWSLSITSAWAGLTDTALQRSNTVGELTDISSCLHLDLALINCKIEKVRTELHTQTERGSFIAILRLTSLLRFLNERTRHLAAGALDPQYPDPTWGYQYSFDRPSDEIWCASNAAENICEKKSEDTCINERGTPYETEEICWKNGSLPASGNNNDIGMFCPFDANYAPAFDNGFGCDIEIMEPRSEYPPVKAELASLKALSGSLAAYRKTAENVWSLQQKIDSLFNGTTSTPTTPRTSSREHLNAYGCGWMGGWCDDDITKRCTSDNDCDDTCIFSDSVCQENRAIRCTSNEQCGEAGIDGPCIEALEPTLRSIRGNFSLDRDQVTILKEFLNVRSQQEISRIFRSDLQIAAEIPENKPDLQRKRAKEDSDPIYFLWRSSLRFAIQTWSRIQARGESSMYPNIDAPLENEKALGDLHSKVSELARISSDKSGLRDFVTQYAWFLRRSCIYRSCNLLLDQALKLVTTDACFPYTNGEYLKDDPDNPRWEKCKDAAGIK